jgi:hypothetical protein
MEQPVHKSHNGIRCEIVTRYEQLLHVHVVRGICFLDEMGVKANVIFDGNDWQATHIVVYDQDEPIGNVRIRWFRDFVQFERTAFRKEWRDPRILKAAAEFAFAHVARKGYERVITHAAPVYARMWCRLLGFQPVPGKEPLEIPGHETPYVELEKALKVPANAITSSSHANVLFGVEGNWDTMPEAGPR